MDEIHKLREQLTELRARWAAPRNSAKWVIGNSDGCIADLLDIAATEAVSLGLDSTPLVRLERIAIPAGDIAPAIDAALLTLDEIELQQGIRQKVAKVQVATVPAADAKAALRRVLRPRFDSLGGELTAVLLDYSKKLGADQAKQECPLISPSDRLAGGIYGDDGRIRLFALRCDDKHLKTTFMRLAEEAGNCLGIWAADFGIETATIGERYGSTRWIYALFDLALRRRPGFPMDAEQIVYGNMRIFFALMRLRISQPEEQEANRLKEEIQQLASLGWYAQLNDLCRASLYAIDLLTSNASLPPAPQQLTQPQAARQPSEANDKDKESDPSNRYENLDILQPAHRLAYLSFLYAQAKLNGRRLEDREAHDWLNENGIEDAGELSDYILPDYSTWTRYLRKARNAIGEQKYTPRTKRRPRQ